MVGFFQVVLCAQSPDLAFEVRHFSFSCKHAVSVLHFYRLYDRSYVSVQDISVIVVVPFHVVLAKRITR